MKILLFAMIICLVMGACKKNEIANPTASFSLNKNVLTVGDTLICINHSENADFYCLTFLPVSDNSQKFFCETFTHDTAKKVFTTAGDYVVRLQVSRSDAGSRMDIMRDTVTVVE